MLPKWAVYFFWIYKYTYCPTITVIFYSAQFSLFHIIYTDLSAMAPKDVGAIVGTWTTKCIELLPKVTDLSQGLVNGDGKPVSLFNKDTWGIDIRTCYQYCDPSKIPLA